MSESASTVSVVMPCYNAAMYVGEAIESVLGQTYDSIELIIVDDGSTDRSLEVIRSFGDDVQVIAQENHGACRARNRGAEAAEGAYLMFLDADDVIGPRTIEALQDAIADREEAIARCSWKYLVSGPDGWEREASGMDPTPPNEDPILGWLTGWFAPTCGILWTRKAFFKTEGWDETLHTNQDGDLMLRALIQGIPLVRTEKGQALYRKHGPGHGSVSTRSSKRALRSYGRVLEKAWKRLQSKGQLEAYREVIGRKYYTLARRLATSDRELSKSYEQRARELAGDQAMTGTTIHRWATKVLGLQNKERLIQMLGTNQEREGV